jgi:hypothetical protein
MKPHYIIEMQRDGEWLQSHSFRGEFETLGCASRMFTKALKLMNKSKTGVLEAYRLVKVNSTQVIKTVKRKAK